MRYLFGFLCVCALGLMPLVGCSETAGTGGSGGDGGAGGEGGTGGMPECQSPEDCDDDNECTDDTCLAGVCEFMPVPDPTGPEEPGDPPGEGTTCGYYEGTCEGGSCAGTFACTEAGIREAIAAGAGPHTFACNGATTVATWRTAHGRTSGATRCAKCGWWTPRRGCSRSCPPVWTPISGSRIATEVAND